MCVGSPRPRYANLFLHPVKDDDAPGYRDVILRYVALPKGYSIFCVCTAA